LQFGQAWFADAIVHTTGLLAGLIACLALVFIAIRRARTTSHPSVKSRVLLALGLYGLGLICMLTCSALYNLYVDHPLRDLLRRFDHAAIFVMIAGTVTPFALLCTRGPQGLRLFAAIWALAAAGIVLKLTIPTQFEQLSLPAYLLLGWTVVLMYRPLKAAIPSPGLPLLAAGCALYTAGIAIYLWDGLAYQLAIWHGVVLLAASLHFACIVGYATGPTVLRRACAKD
jgi:hemolysin III